MPGATPAARVYVGRAFPDRNAQDGTVDTVEEPKFAQHLPPGGFLNWAFGTEAAAGRNTRFVNVPDDHVVRDNWARLSEHVRHRIASTSERTETLEFIHQQTNGDIGVAFALVKNPSIPYPMLAALVDHHRGNDAFLNTVREARTQTELGRLLCDGFDFSGYARQNVTWLAAVTEETGDLDTPLRVLDPSYHPLYLQEVAHQDPEQVNFPVSGLIEALDQQEVAAFNDSFWAGVARHAAHRGDDRDIRRLLTLVRSVPQCVVLVEHSRVTLEEALGSLRQHQHPELLRRHSEHHPLTTEQTAYVDTLGLPEDALHDLRFSPEAARWAIAHASGAMAGAAAWQLDTDSALVGALRRHPESHRWTRYHLRRAGRIWHRLSQTARKSMLSTLDGTTLASLNVTPIREWVIGFGDPAQIKAIGVQRSEFRQLLDRAERSGDSSIAWTAAHLAERPRERVRLAEIGLRGGDSGDDLRRWLKTATSAEIVKLWNLTGDEHRSELSAALVRNVRLSEDNLWLRRIAGSLQTEWQAAPAAVQEAAAVYLAEHAGSDEIRQTVWALYAQWTGTLEDLIAAAREL